MITINHNFDASKFKWLWAKYVHAGRLDVHCQACIIGPFSHKFNGNSELSELNKNTIVMDEYPLSTYDAIYFCGVIKRGLESGKNYRHNVHFAVHPEEGRSDEYDFENWHVEITGGTLEVIPATYELSDSFFGEGYHSHYWTCRIFRWMVGHYYPEKLVDLTKGNSEMEELYHFGVEQVKISLENWWKNEDSNAYRIIRKNHSRLTSKQLSGEVLLYFTREDYLDLFKLVDCRAYVDVWLNDRKFRGLVSENITKEDAERVIDRGFAYEVEQLFGATGHSRAFH